MSVLEDQEGYVVKLRGLPWSTSALEIQNFLSDCNIKNGKAGIHMTMSREGRQSGEAYVEMETDKDMECAIKKDRDYMGSRYIEVFKAKRSEMEWVVKRSGLNAENTMDDGCVRLQGLPFGCSKEEIAQFFSGLEIVPNGITLLTDITGRSTGEAYVQFVSKEVAEKALDKHKETIGHRYIEIFRCSLSEVKTALELKMRPMGPGGFSQRPAPYDRGDRFGGMNRFHNMGRASPSFKGFGESEGGPSPWGCNSAWGGGGGGPGSVGGRGGGMGGRGMNSGGFGGMGGAGRGRGGGNGWSSNGMGDGHHCVHMRGLPYRASYTDIAEFFRPIAPVRIKLEYDDSGRPSGEADVEFATHEDAVKGMSKDKERMQHRYIELFLNSTPGGVGGFGGFGGTGEFEEGFGESEGGPSPWGCDSAWGGGGGGGRGVRGSGGGRGGGMGGRGMNSGGFGGMGGAGRGRGGGNGWSSNGMGDGHHCVHMRGLPYRAAYTDIAEFFRPIAPVRIKLEYDDSGRPSGEADVEFATHEDAVEAMSKDKERMQHRYIELFLNSTPGGAGGFGGFGGTGEFEEGWN